MLIFPPETQCIPPVEFDNSLRKSPVISLEQDMAFAKSELLTLGVEIELQLLEPDTLDLTSRAKDILQTMAHHEKIRPEFYLSTIEINTGICKHVQAVEHDLKQTIQQLTQVTQALGIRLASTGSHPFSEYKDWTFSSNDRYQDLINKAQWLTRRMCVFGLHVHLGMSSGDECIRYHNFFTYFLPHLLALSSSSPYWQGIDTGLSSSRPSAYESLPTAGQPYALNHWQDFENLCTALKSCKAINCLKDLWWDMRPSPNFGTLEIRVCDGVATLSETLAITAFIHSLAHWFKEKGEHHQQAASAWLPRENKWRVMRYGLDADLVITDQGETIPIKEDILKWMERIKPYAKKSGYLSYFETLANTIERGNSSARQRKVFERTGSYKAVVQHNVDEFASR